MNKPKQNNNLTELEYTALLFRLTLEYASEISGRSMSEISKNVTKVLDSMPSTERQRLAIQSDRDISNLHKIYQYSYEQ